MDSNETFSTGTGPLPRRLAGIVRITAAVAALIVAAAVPAHADPDPHLPNPQSGYCPGGSMGSPIYAGYCDGEHYPDGSYWHTRQWGLPLYGNNNGLLGTNGGGPAGAECVVDNGSPLPPAAPPGGCGGAWQPPQPG